MKKNLLMMALWVLVLGMSGCVNLDWNSILTGQRKQLSSNNQMMIEQALLEKHPGWNRQDIEVVIKKIDRGYATGSVGDKGGGGAGWLAYRENGEWQIVYEGNSVPLCDMVQSYGFPTTVVNKCWDEQNNEEVDLTDNNQKAQNSGVDEELLLNKAVEEYLVDGDMITDITVNSIEGDYAEGSVTLDNDNGGWWLAVKENDGWQVVALGSDIIDCQTVEQYGFPSDMVMVCYDDTTNDSKVLLTKSDIDKYVQEVSAKMGWKIGKISDMDFDWEEYSGVVTVEGRGATFEIDANDWQAVEEAVVDAGYEPDTNNYAKTSIGFYVKDILLCDVAQSTATMGVIRCGAR